jgi:hypothetical protein
LILKRNLQMKARTRHRTRTRDAAWGGATWMPYAVGIKDRSLQVLSRNYGPLGPLLKLRERPSAAQLRAIGATDDHLACFARMGEVEIPLYKGRPGQPEYALRVKALRRLTDDADFEGYRS